MSYVFLVGLSGDAARGMRAWAAFAVPGRAGTQAAMSEKREEPVQARPKSQLRRGVTDFRIRERPHRPAAPRRYKPVPIL